MVPHSLVLILRASAPSVSPVAVWLSLQTSVMPGEMKSCSGEMMWTCPAAIADVEIFDAEIGAIGLEWRDLLVRQFARDRPAVRCGGAE